MMYVLLAAMAVSFGSCKENYSQGEKVGNLIEFTKKGVVWDSWEGSMNLTQTGMNTSGEPFYFSFDNDRADQDSLIELMKRAQVEGWKRGSSVTAEKSSSTFSRLTRGRSGAGSLSFFSQSDAQTKKWSDRVSFRPM